MTGTKTAAARSEATVEAPTDSSALLEGAQLEGAQLEGAQLEGAQLEGAQHDVAPRVLRADARRNHDQLLVAAGELFAERGIDVPLEEIAKRAEVGIGTLYRHFPTRDALNEAVYRHEVETLCDGVDELIATRTPDDALASWMTAFVAYVARKRGMAVALKSALGADAELFSSSRRRIYNALDQLLANAIAAQVIRADVDSEDLIGAMSGICMASDNPGWATRSNRLVELLIDGLRYRAPSA